MRQSKHAQGMICEPKNIYSRSLHTLVAIWVFLDVQAAPNNGRILFKHGLSGTEHAHRFHDNFRRGLSEQQQRPGNRNLLQEGNASALHFVSLGKHVGVDMVEIPEGMSYEWVLEELKKHPEIEFAEEDKVVSAYTVPNDPSLPQQWALYQMGLFTDSSLDNGLVEQGAWNRTFGGEVIVCVIDSGLDYTHPDLAHNVWVNENEIPDNGLDDDDNGYIDDYHGINVINISGDVMDDNFHGTHLAGMVGALCNNNLGICGISPVVKLMGCKFLDNKGNGYTSDAVKCLDYALQMGVDVTLNSYGGLNADSDALKTAITAANRAGQLFVTAAGNDYGTDIDATPTFPAAYQMPNILSVISTNESMELAPFSNYGAKLADLAAPGSHILSTTLNGGYGEHDGTSQSAGYVAGAAALILAAYRQTGFKNATGSQMKEVLMKGARQLPQLRDKCKAGGILDVASAMSLVPFVAPSTDNASWLLSARVPPGAGSSQSPPTTDRGSPFSSGLFGSMWGPEQAMQSLRPPTPLIPLALLPPALRALDPRISKKSLPVHGAGSPPHAPPLPPAAAAIQLGALAQPFRDGFPLSYSSLTFVPHPAGLFTTCSRPRISQLPSYPLAGLDVTADVLEAPTGHIIDLAGPVQVGTAKVPHISVTRYGDLRLLQTLPSSAEASAQAGNWTTFFEVARIAVVGSSEPFTRVNKVLYNRRPDRLVVTYSGVYFGNQTDPSAFQVELFTGGRTLRAGSVRLTWLQVRASTGVIGISGGQQHAASTVDFTAGAPCPQPAVLMLNETSPIKVILHSDRTTTVRTLTIWNPGSLVLNVAVDAFPTGASLLERRFCPHDSAPWKQSSKWLQNAPSIAVASPPAGGGQEKCVAEPHGWSGVKAEPTVRLAKRVQTPLRIRGSFVRGAACGLQWLALSTHETLPEGVGDGSTVWIALSPQYKYLYSASMNLTSVEVCADTTPNMVNITVDGEAVLFRDDQCGRLVARHSLGSGPLYLHTRLAALPGCSGDMPWDYLEVTEGVALPPIQIPALRPTAVVAAVPSGPAPALPPASPSPPTHSLPAHPVVESASLSQLSAKSLPSSSSLPPGAQVASGLSAAIVKAGMRILVRRRPDPPPSRAAPGAAGAPAPALGAYDAVEALAAISSDEDAPWEGIATRVNMSSAGNAASPDKPTHVDWASVSETGLIVPPGGSAQIRLLLNSTGVPEGRHPATLVLRSNDPDRPVARLILGLTVA